MYHKKEKDFIKTVWNYYKKEGRYELPWRKTKNVYFILVSEVMLQQTQADRVISKYKEFLKVFPNTRSLAFASLGDVLRMWQGLGYNRRAKMLHEMAKRIMKEYAGTFPKTYKELKGLPGVGPYTAGAVMAFAYNTPSPIIETNIRTVFIHHFFNNQSDISDADIYPLIERTLDRENPREWYYALMDYGAYVKRTIGNPNRQSKHYTTQSAFKGSDRQIRGAIIRALTEHGLTRSKLHRELPFDMQRIDEQLARLQKEGMVSKKGANYLLPL